MVKAISKLGGERVGGDLVPLGSVDFSSYLIKAQGTNPDVIVFLVQGDDMLNAMKQAVQFGLQNKVHLAGAQQEMEPLEGLPPEARVGVWVMEWYWNQPGVPHVAEFVEATKKRTGRVPTARTWFGYVSVWTCALAAAKANSLKAPDMAKALQDFHLPPEIALGPNPAFYRAGQNQLLATLFVGQAQAAGSAPDDLFKVTNVINGADVAGTVEESGCKMTWPT
jgi:branched-chain amino acid transport system substrate-binding protein